MVQVFALKIRFLLFMKRRPKVTASLILKFGQGAKPDPTIPLQKALKKNKGIMPPSLNTKAEIKKIEILPPGKLKETQNYI